MTATIPTSTCLQQTSISMASSLSGLWTRNPLISPAASEFLLDGTVQSCQPTEHSISTAGSSNNCHLSETGTFNWGDNTAGQLNFPNQPYSAVALSHYRISHSDTNGALSCHGQNADEIDFQGNHTGISGGENTLCAISAGNQQLQCTVPLDLGLLTVPVVQVRNDSHGCAIDSQG